MSESATTIAQWMLNEYKQRNILVQRHAAVRIKMQFGDGHVYRNKNRNYGINKDILDEFRKLTDDDVVWSRSRQLWRKRRATDPQDSRMVK